MLNTINELFTIVDDRCQLIIYGVGYVGKLVYIFFRNHSIPVDAFIVTKSERKGEVEGIPVYGLDDFLNLYYSDQVIIILGGSKIIQNAMKEELQIRKIDSYIMLSDVIIYELEREKQRSDTLKMKNCKKFIANKSVGYLTPGYYDTNYAEKRLIIDKIEDVSYVAIPKENMKVGYWGTQYKENLDGYKQIVDACYCPQGRIPGVSLIHTFNMVCSIDELWCTSFETSLPRLWPQTESELEYFLELIDCMKKPNCKAIYALCENAYRIQRQHLSYYIDPKDVDILMKKTKILHPQQKVLITRREFEIKHSLQSIQFIFIGTNFFIKGGKEIIKVLSEFEGKYEFGFTLISSMLYDDYLTKTPYEEMIKWKKIVQEKDWIDYYEWLPNELVLEKCKKATVGLLPSFADTYGYSVLEMQAAGCPVVTTNVRAFPETNNNDCGWICQIPVNKFGIYEESGKENGPEILEQELRRCFQDIFCHPSKIREKGLRALNRIYKMHNPYEYQRELRTNLF